LFTVIIAVFTIGTWINRREPTEGDPDHRTPLLQSESPSPEEVDDASGFDASKLRSLRNREYLHSRILARFPFLLEIFYWLLTYWIYQGCRAISARIIAGNESIFQKAEHHALQLLSFEHKLHIDIELSVQRFVLQKCPWLMNVLAKAYYSHIILGVMFLVYCYTFFPRDRYQGIRRALALINILAFTIISSWRCKPPRLLPEEYGFIDVLLRRNASSGSTWTQNKFQLTIAAMPSIHFGMSVFIAFCVVKYSPHLILRVLSVFWPFLMGITVLATANHFVMDGIVGVLVIGVAFWLNRVMLVLLPVERMLFRLLRLEKPRDSPPR
ncbi:hypothetical protein N7456_006298, partial [Penicillium angulare]